MLRKIRLVVLGLLFLMLSGVALLAVSIMIAQIFYTPPGPNWRVAEGTVVSREYIPRHLELGTENHLRTGDPGVPETWRLCYQYDIKSRTVGSKGCQNVSKKFFDLAYAGERVHLDIRIKDGVILETTLLGGRSGPRYY